MYKKFSILDLRKLLMYEFNYNDIQKGKKYNSNLLLTVTDSFFYETETNYVYKDFYESKDLFDFSDYPKDSKFLDPVNKNVIAKMKHEFKGKIISEFVGLKSKKYSLIDVDIEENKKTKGVNKKCC